MAKIGKITFIILAIIALYGCGNKSYGNLDGLRNEIESAVTESKGIVGVALIAPDGDTLTVNNDVEFPLMSVFKLHEAIAAAEVTDRRNQSFDTLLALSRAELSSDTWSPMLKDYPEGDISISLGQLIKYMLLVSDNNASNVIFDRIVSVSETDSIISSLDLSGEFALRYTEREMQADHDKSYRNWSSPMACATLIKKVFDNELVSQEKQDSIRSWLGQCTSANDRMAAGIAAYEGSKLYHRTGSGYTNDCGEITAINDVGFIKLPDGRHLAIAILVKDYAGAQEEADSEIATITKIILKHFYNGKEKK